MVCSILTAIMFLMPPIDFIKSLAGTFRDYDTLKLLGIVAFILMLSSCLKESGALKDMVDSLRMMAWDNRFTMALLPALIGFLPMPGGALFSAPMIEGFSDEAEISPERRTFINYWFRHVWEYCYPLYPGLLLAATILKVNIGQLIVFQLPLSLAAIFAGVVFQLVRIKYVKKQISPGVSKLALLWKFSTGFWPVMLIVVGIFVVPWKILLPGFPEIDPLMITLPLTVILFGIPRLGFRRFFKVIITNFDFRLPLTVLSVLIFKDVITNSGAVDNLSTAFQTWGIPPLALFLVLPFLMGYLTGITHSYVSVAYPLLMPFFLDNGQVDLASTQLAYTSGFVGVILSPVHLCLILSLDYFRADFNRVLRMLYAPSLLVLLVSLIIYWLF